MNLESLSSALMRTLFIASFALLALALTEFAANSFGYTLIRGVYTTGRLLELAAVFLVFVMTLLLRQIRDQQKTG
jgi:hypothetical protein